MDSYHRLINNFMEFSLEKFDEIKNEAEIFYKAIGKIRCPYFGDDIHFNTKGWGHLIFKNWNTTRVVNDQFARLRHIKLAPEVIRQSKTLQGMWTTKKIERVQKNSRWEKVLKLITYYEFIAVMESHNSKIRVKVIVKEVEGSEKFFWSLIPFWGVDKNTGDRTMYSGNPENE